VPAFETIAETVEALRKWTKGLEDSSWAACESEDGPAFGRVALFPNGFPANRVWEAARMIAFDTRGVRRILADIDPGAALSIRTVENSDFSERAFYVAIGKPISACATESRNRYVAYSAHPI